MQIRTFDLSVNSFEGMSRKRYVVHDTLSVERFNHFEQLQVEVLNNTSLRGFIPELRNAWSMLQKYQIADAIVTINNILNGSERIQNKQPHPILKMCTLFICEENEPFQWSEAMAVEKLADWADIDQSFFLGCGLRFLKAYSHALSTSIPHGSEESKADGIDNEQSE